MSIYFLTHWIPEICSSIKPFLSKLWSVHFCPSCGVYFCRILHQSQLVLKCSFPIWSFLYIFLQDSAKLSPSFHSFCSILTNYFTALTLFFANAHYCPLYIARTCFFTCMYKWRVPFLFPIYSAMLYIVHSLQFDSPLRNLKIAKWLTLAPKILL